MSSTNQVSEKLLFLTTVVRREMKHLLATDQRLFTQPFTPEIIAKLDDDENLAERVEAFVSRFGRLQDTLGDKLLPNLLAFVGERPATAMDNLDRAERLGWIKSADGWLETRKLRNQMVHEDIQSAEILADALNIGHQYVAELNFAADQMLAAIEKRLI